MAKKLEAAGSIVRTPSPVDARVNFVDLTDRGRALSPRLNEAWVALAHDTVAGLKESSTASTSAVLDDLVRSLWSLYGRRATASGADAVMKSCPECHAEGAF